MLIKEPTISHGLYLDSTSQIDDLQLSDLEIHVNNQRQSLKGDDSQTQSSSSFQTREDVLKQLGLNQTLVRSTMESMAGPFNHQCSIYYVQRSIEELVQSSPQENSLAILQLCFEEDIAREFQTHLVKNSLLKHQSLQYWMHLYIEYVNDQVNNKQNIQNNGTKQGEWYSNNAGNSKTGIWEINCVRLGFEDVDSFVRTDTKLLSIVESENHWFHGTNESSAQQIKKNGIILRQGKQYLDFSHGQGFYLSPNLTDAKKWALQKSQIVRSTIGAVLIYNFSQNDFKGLLFNTNDEWQSVVRYYRSGMISSILENLKNRLENTDYIFGEIASRNKIPIQGADIEKWEEWEPEALPKKYQLCITGDKMAKIITPELKDIIYLTP